MRRNHTFGRAGIGAAGLLLLVLGGCSHPARPPHVTGHPGRRAIAPRRVPLTQAELRRLRPNEVGRIPILMYHAIGAAHSGRGVYDRHGLNISAATFRKQLQMMYDAGWRPVNMRDTLTAHLDLPAGKTPVVLTFDDARGTQFRYRPDGRIDPDCAVGILEAFHAKHPDWATRATFYVLPRSVWNPAPFWQPGLETKKLRYLVAQGFEVANHSTTHRLMRHMDAHMLCWEMAECDRYVKMRAPGATMDTMALPGGDAPRNHALWRYLISGSFHITHYNNRCILMAWGGPAYPWSSKRFDPERIPRLAPMPGAVERCIERSRLGKPSPFYVSDGDPATVTVPSSQAKYVDPRRLQGARLVVYRGAPDKVVVTASAAPSPTR